MATVSDSDYYQLYNQLMTQTTHTFPTTTYTGTTAYAPITMGPSQVYSYYGQSARPSMRQWNNQVFLEPSQKMRTLMTALQLL